MSKSIIFNKELSKRIDGMNKAADAVVGTIGPKGLNVYIDNEYIPEITNDGVYIAQNITLEDPIENTGSYLIKNVCSQTNDDVGDGTTTTACLTQAIVNECLKRPENPVEIRESLKESKDKVLKTLIKNSYKLKKGDIEKIALISSENQELAKIITKIIDKLGEKAVINVEDSKTFNTEYEIVDGYEANIGFMSPYFINDKKSAKASYQDIPILVSKKRISNLQDIKQIFDKFKEKNITQCVFVVEDIDDSILGILVQNKLMGIFNSLVIRTSGDILDDIEGATGATAISDSTGVNFQTVNLSHLGIAKKVVCDSNKTLFLGNGVKAKLYAKNLENQLNNETNIYSINRINQRIAKLNGGVAVLKVGASTDLERVYLRRKAEDAVKAVQAAISEGIVDGGGMAFWKIANELNEKTIGDQILKKVLISPLKRIIENSGKDYAETIQKMPKDKGYDAKNDCYVDMIENGIIDPLKVERIALENSVSAASTFITTFCLIIDNKDEKK